jgi:hypothetical protein
MYQEVTLNNISVQPVAQQEFYFTAASGKVTKISAKNKEVAEEMYQQVLMPLIFYPTYCWMRKERCDNRHCGGSPSPYSGSGCIIESKIYDFEHYKERREKYIGTYHKLLTRFPDCDILERLKIMYYDTPTYFEDDFQATIQNTDGSIKKHMPASLVLHWPKANVRFKTDVVSNPKTHNWFEQFITAINGSYLFNFCYYLLIYQIDHMTADQIDKLGGSMEASTEPPVEQLVATECLDTVEQPQPRREGRARDFLRRRPQYNPIEFQQVGVRLTP